MIREAKQNEIMERTVISLVHNPVMAKYQRGQDSEEEQAEKVNDEIKEKREKEEKEKEEVKKRRERRRNNLSLWTM